MTTLIVCATHKELASFFTLYNLEEQPFFQPGARLFSKNPKKDTGVDILISGPGICNCAFALSSYLSLKQPERIFQVGIAGVFPESGLETGDIAVSDEIQYLHAGVETEGQVVQPLPFSLLKDHPDTSFGSYPCDSSLARFCVEYLQEYKENFAARVFPGETFQVVSGKILTVSMITGTRACAADIFRRFAPVMEAMEGAGAAHGAALYGIPIVEIRAGSNVAGDRNKFRWEMELACRRISWALDTLMDFFH